MHKGRYHVAGGPTVTEFFSDEATQLNPARHWFHIAKWTSSLSDKSYLDVGASLAYGNNDMHPQSEVAAGAIPHYDNVTRSTRWPRSTTRSILDGELISIPT